MEPYMIATPAAELQSRIDKLQRQLQLKGVQAALIVQKTDLFYFSGTSQQGWLYVPEAGAPLLMVFKDYERARRESTLAEVVSLVSPKSIPALLGERGYPLPAFGLQVIPFRAGAGITF